MTADEARDAYACISATMAEGYAKSGNQWAASYLNWRNVAAQPYVSDTHGARYVNNYAKDIGADNYSMFEEAAPAPAGTVLAKDSFVVKPNGNVSAGPLFLMEKMEAGFDADTGDWRYTLIMPNGKTIGTTGGKGAKNVRLLRRMPPRRRGAGQPLLPRRGVPGPVIACRRRAVLRAARRRLQGRLDRGCEPGLCSPLHCLIRH